MHGKLLNKTKVELELLTDTDMLFMGEKGIRGRMCHSINRYAKTNNRYMKDCDKIRNHHIYWDVNNLCCWAMLQKLPVNGFKWVEDLTEFDEGFIESYNEKVKDGYFLEMIFNTKKNFMNFIMISHFN